MVRRESRPNTISHITLGTKQTGAPSAGNLHAGCDVAGAGNGFTVWLLRHSQRKRGATARLDLRNTAPVLDPTLGLYLKRPPRNSRQSHDPWPGASDTALRLLARVAESPSWRRNFRLVRYPRAEQMVTQYAVAKSNMAGVSTNGEIVTPFSA